MPIDFHLATLFHVFIQDLEARLRELKLDESVFQENATKIEELVVKLESADAMNRKLLTEMAALQIEKTTVETVAANLSQEEATLRGLLSQNEISNTNHRLQLRWHYLREFRAYLVSICLICSFVRAGRLRDADGREEAPFGRE